jgi:hypothetical protein
MALKIKRLNHRAWPVTVTLQESDDNGVVTATEQTFVAHFKPVTEEEREAITAKVNEKYPLPKDGERDDMRVVLARNAEYFSHLVVGWGDDVQNEDGTPTPFTQAALTALVTGPDGLAISQAMVRADNEIRFGVAPAKNFKTSPAHGEISGAVEVATSLPTI